MFLDWINKFYNIFTNNEYRAMIGGLICLNMHKKR